MAIRANNVALGQFRLKSAARALRDDLGHVGHLDRSGAMIQVHNAGRETKSAVLAGLILERSNIGPQFSLAIPNLRNMRRGIGGVASPAVALIARSCRLWIRRISRPLFGVEPVSILGFPQALIFKAPQRIFERHGLPHGNRLCFRQVYHAFPIGDPAADALRARILKKLKV
jgi:hypothetical protein